jgi:transcriptional regulator with XRE-family HTH domain
MSLEARRLLRQRMVEMDLSQSRLAVMLDRTPSTVCRWLDEDRPSTPDATALVGLEVALGIPIALWLTHEQREGIAALKSAASSDVPPQTGTDG